VTPRPRSQARLALCALLAATLALPLPAQDAEGPPPPPAPAGAESDAEADSHADADADADVGTPRVPLSQRPPGDFLEAAKHGTAGEDTPLPTASVITASIGRGVDYLLRTQNEDGSWGSWDEPAHEFWSNPYTHKAWIAGTTGLVVMSLLDQHEHEPAHAAADRGLDYLFEHGISKRPSDWDVDNTWGLVYSLDCATTALLHGRYRGSAREPKLRKLAQDCIAELRNYQTPSGGWGYYDFDTLAARPSWATSFETAAAIVGLAQARDLGLDLPEDMLALAVKGLSRTRLANGAYDYSLDPVPQMNAEWINNVKGSLSRIQSGNYALLRAGAEQPTREQILWGLDQFFQHHRFLDVARKKPSPHEAYYLNSGYFYFFGHFYAARLLDTLPEAERSRYAMRLAREIVKTQEQDGSMWDFHFNTYGRPYGTAFGVMTLVRTLPER
jgi:hypothetical protein